MTFEAAQERYRKITLALAATTARAERAALVSERRALVESWGHGVRSLVKAQDEAARRFFSLKKPARVPDMVIPMAFTRLTDRLEPIETRWGAGSLLAYTHWLRAQIEQGQTPPVQRALTNEKEVLLAELEAALRVLSQVRAPVSRQRS